MDKELKPKGNSTQFAVRVTENIQELGLLKGMESIITEELYMKFEKQLKKIDK